MNARFWQHQEGILVGTRHFITKLAKVCTEMCREEAMLAM